MNEEQEKIFEDLPPEWRENARKFAKFIEEIQPVLQAVGKYVADALEKWQPAFQAISHIVEQWDKNRKENVIFMVQNGWFPSWKAILRGERNSALLDKYMMERIKQSLPEIQSRLIELYPHRRKFIKHAFQLHGNGDYIASIPLILIQADGICEENLSPFFSRDPLTKKKFATEFLELVDSRNRTLDWFNQHLLEPLKIVSQIQRSSINYSEADKLNGPNRHGILHGSKDHLDYPTEINSYKTISFLAFVSTILNRDLQNLWMQNLEPPIIAPQTNLIENGTDTPIQ